MSLRVGELHALLRVDDRQFHDGLRKGERGLRSLDQQIDRTTRRLDAFGTSLNRIGRRMTVALTAPLAAAAVASVKLGSDMAATHDLLNDTFREGSEAAREFAHEMAEAMGRSKLQMEGFMATTQGLFAPLMENRELAGEMSKVISTLAVDLASFYNVADDDALRALQTGLLGNTEPMRKFGVIINEATLEQEAMRLGLGRTTAEMSEQEKVLLRLSLVLGQTTDSHGDAIRTIGEFDNQLKALQADIVNLSTEIGGMLLPTARGLVGWARQLTEGLQDLSPETKETLIGFVQIVAVAGPLTLAISSIVRGIASTGRALRLLTNMLRSNPYMALGLLVGGLALSFDEVQASIDSLLRRLGMGDFVDTITGIESAFGELIDTVKGAEFAPGEFDIDAYVESLEKQRDDIAERLRQGLSEPLTEGLEGALGDAFEDAGPTLLDELQEMFDGLPDAIDRAVNVEVIKREMQETLGRILPEFDEEEFRRRTKLDMLGEMVERAVAEGIDDTRLFGQMIEQFVASGWVMPSVSSMVDEALEGVNLEARFRNLIGDPLPAVERFEMGVRDLGRALREVLEDGYDPGSSVVQRLIAEINVFEGALRRARVNELVADFQEALAGPDASQRRMMFWVDDLELAQRSLTEIEHLTQSFIADMEASEAPAGEIREHVEDARRAWMDLNHEVLHLSLQQARDEFERTMGIGQRFAEMMAQATGEAFDPLDFQIDALQAKLEAQIDAAKEFAAAFENADVSQLDLLAGFVDPGTLRQLEELLQQRFDRDFRQTITDILADLDRDIANMDLLADLAFLRHEEFDRAENELRRLERAIIDANLALITAGDVSDDVLSAMQSELDDLIAKYDELSSSIDRTADRVGDILGELERDLTVRMGVEHLIASATGAEFDPVEYERRAIERSINRIVDEMMRAGDSFGDIRDEIEPLIDRLRSLGTESGLWERQLESAIDQADDFAQWLMTSLDPMRLMFEIMQRAIPIAEVVTAALEVLEPVTSALAGPLRAFGIALGTIVEPLLVALEPALRLLAEISLMLAMAFVRVRQWVLQLFLALARGIDAIPFVSAKTAIRNLEKAIAEQQDRYDDLLKAQDRLRNGMDEAAEAAMGFSRNIPRIFRVNLERFRAADITDLRNIPALATGGFVPPTPGGQIVRLSEAGEGEYVIPESRMGAGGGVTVNMTVNGPLMGTSKSEVKRWVRRAVGQGQRQAQSALYGR